jgi:hypothetical protein
MIKLLALIFMLTGCITIDHDREPTSKATATPATIPAPIVHCPAPNVIVKPTVKADTPKVKKKVVKTTKKKKAVTPRPDERKCIEWKKSDVCEKWTD